MRVRLVAVVSSLLASSCSLVYPLDYAGPDGGARDVAASDGATDVARDGAPDGVTDGTSDVVGDETIDVASDGASDVVVDGTLDVAVDAPIDVASDAPDGAVDVLVDAMSDAAVDSAPDVPADRADGTADVPADTASSGCSAGQIVCGGVCVDALTDVANCGACGTRCAVTCSRGVCIRAVDVRVGQGDNNAVHACALMSDRTVRCWGANGYGQLGNGTLADSARPVPVAGLSDVAEIAVGSGHTCARVGDGSVWCWGSGTYGQLGDGAARRSTPGVVPSLNGVTALTAGGGSSAQGYTCAIDGAARVLCWGSNGFSQCGTTGPTVATPTVVGGATGADRVSAGAFHTCARRPDGVVLCWGMGTGGQLGDGRMVTSATPVAAVGLAATAVSAGSESSCAVATGGGVACWGYDRNGAVGRGTTGLFATPGGLSSTLTAATAVSVGAYHACALVAGSPLHCWGSDNEGQLGLGGTLQQRATPVAVAAVVGATAVSCGYQATCVVAGDGNAWCFGRNAQGQLGDGTTVSSRTPVRVRF